MYSASLSPNAFYIELSHILCQLFYIGANFQDQLSQANKEISSLKEKLIAVEQAKEAAEKESIQQIRELENSRYDMKVLEDELSQSNQTNKSANQKIAELQAGLDEIKSRYQEHVQDSRSQSTKHIELIESLKTTESNYEGEQSTCLFLYMPFCYIELSIKHDALKCDHEILHKKHDELLRISHGMESRLEEFREREADAQIRVQEEIEKAQEAIIDKQKLSLREETLAKEVQRLEERLTRSAEKYKDKAETEIATIRTQFLAEKHRLNQEIGLLEESASKMKIMAERAMREKRYCLVISCNWLGRPKVS